MLKVHSVIQIEELFAWSAAFGMFKTILPTFTEHLAQQLYTSLL